MWFAALSTNEHYLCYVTTQMRMISRHCNNRVVGSVPKWPKNNCASFAVMALRSRDRLWGCLDRVDETNWYETIFNNFVLHHKITFTLHLNPNICMQKYRRFDVDDCTKQMNISLSCVKLTATREPQYSKGNTDLKLFVNAWLVPSHQEKYFFSNQNWGWILTKQIFC